MTTSSTALALVALLTLAGPHCLAETLDIHVRDGGRKGPVPCRIHLRGPDGKAVLHSSLPSYRDHFVCRGEATLDVAPGEYALTVERGPEYRRVTRSITVAGGETTTVNVELRRLIDLAARGWWSGELHVHRKLEEMALHLRAEDLHVAPVLTVWNQRNIWKERPLPEEKIVTVDGDRFYNVLACEDERQGGALLFFNLREPLDLSDQGREYPSPIANLERAVGQRGSWVDIEKPFWWDVPTWVATGKIDSIGIANNHMCRSTMYPNEAWGRPRDESRLPPPRGNGFFTQELYYRLLDCGFRIPPSAGSASGVLPNPVGYNRVYVHLGETISHDAWWEGLRAGRSFVTNGPLLLVSASGKLPGARITGAGPIDIDITIDVYGDDPLEAVEVIHDGRSAQRFEILSGATRFNKTVHLRVTESGWFLVRAIALVKETFRFASTAPFSVTIGDRPAVVHREDVEYFIRWIEARMRIIEDGTREKLSGDKLRRVLEPHRRALEHFRKLQHNAR